MVCLNWTLQAEMDLKNIYDFIALDSKKYAQIQIYRIREKVKLLKYQPKLGRIVPEFANNNIR
jgi:toxin ParE1/3/4